MVASRCREPLGEGEDHGGRADILRRTSCFALFRHALDIIWVAVFTIVYLTGFM